MFLFVNYEENMENVEVCLYFYIRFFLLFKKTFFSLFRKKTLFLTLIIFGLLVYFGPGVLRWFLPPPSIEHGKLLDPLTPLSPQHWQFYFSEEFYYN